MGISSAKLGDLVKLRDLSKMGGLLMSRMRKILHPMVGTLSVLAYLAVGFVLWQCLQTRSTPRKHGLAIQRAMRDYKRTGDSHSKMYAFVGDSKQRKFHAFESDCVQEAAPKKLIGFETRNMAFGSGYEACSDCTDLSVRKDSLHGLGKKGKVGQRRISLCTK